MLLVATVIWQEPRESKNWLPPLLTVLAKMEKNVFIILLVYLFESNI